MCSNNYLSHLMQSLHGLADVLRIELKQSYEVCYRDIPDKLVRSTSGTVLPLARSRSVTRVSQLPFSRGVVSNHGADPLFSRRLCVQRHVCDRSLLYQALRISQGESHRKRPRSSDLPGQSLGDDVSELFAAKEGLPVPSPEGAGPEAVGSVTWRSRSTALTRLWPGWELMPGSRSDL